MASPVGADHTRKLEEGPHLRRSNSATAIRDIYYHEFVIRKSLKKLNRQRVSGSFGVRAFTSPSAITPYLYWDNNRLIPSYENSKGLENMSFWLAEQTQITTDWLMFSGTIQYKAERMKGHTYTV